MAKRILTTPDILLPEQLSTVATSTVAEEESVAGGVDILLMPSVDPVTAANAADFELQSHGVDVLLDAAPGEAVSTAPSAEVDRSPQAWEVSPEKEPLSAPNKGKVKKPGFFKRLIMPRKKEGPSRPFWRRWFYTLFFALGMLLIWVPVVSYVTLASPIYNSSWTILIPGTQVDASVDLAGVGEAYTGRRTV